MVDLIETVKNEAYCDSSIVARKFKVQHANFTRVIKRTIKRLEKLRVPIGRAKFIPVDREYRGKKFQAVLMNREAFSLIAMRFETKEALEWQVRFIEAFISMERRLEQLETNKADVAWIGTRKTGKIGRKIETDVIKEFVEYATGQGSKSAKFYYKHITNATYKALGLMHQRKPKLRDTMDMYEISELMLAERVAVNALHKYMELGRHYKDIYESVKNDLIEYSKGLNFSSKLIEDGE
jgi:Rha family phage regulatory protein